MRTGAPSESAGVSIGLIRIPLERHWHGIGNLRKRTGQGVQSAALIVQVQDAMMMVGIGRYDSARDVNVEEHARRREYFRIRSACGHT